MHYANSFDDNDEKISNFDNVVQIFLFFTEESLFIVINISLFDFNSVDFFIDIILRIGRVQYCYLVLIYKNTKNDYNFDLHNIP